MFKNLNTEALGISGRESEVIELVLSNNFRGIDLDIVSFAAEVAKSGLAKAKRLLESARLKIGSFRLPTAWEGTPDEYQKELASIPQWAELAQQLGATRAVTRIEPASDLRPYHENFEAHRRRFTELGEKLQKYDMRLGVEILAPTKLRAGHAFQFIQTYDAAMLLLKSVSAPNVGLALDTWHWHLGGGTLDYLKAFGPEKIVCVSLADAEPGQTADTANETTRKLPGETGVVNNLGVIKLLAEAKYDGPVTPCPHPQRFSGTSRDKIAKAASDSMDQLWTQAGISLGPRRPSIVGR